MHATQPPRSATGTSGQPMLLGLMSVLAISASTIAVADTVDIHPGLLNPGSVPGECTTINPPDALEPDGTVNAIVGDTSFVTHMGTTPDHTTNEDARLALHLQFVEAQLRAVDTSDWPEEQRAAREANLDRLHAYWNAGVFPRNRGHIDERRPCFIDEHGRVCAVGYLMQESDGRALADLVNAQYQYEFVLNMDMPAITDWVAASGLTAVECAMIQPCYGPLNEWASYEADLGNGILIDENNPAFIPIDVTEFDDPYALDIVSGIRLTLDITHERIDDLTIFLVSPEGSTPDGFLPCLGDQPYSSPAVWTTFLLANDAPLGGESSSLDGIYQWRDGEQSIEQAAADANGGVIEEGLFSSEYSLLSEYTQDVLIDHNGNQTMHGAWAPGQWGVYIFDEVDGNSGILRGVTLDVRVNATPTPGALPVLIGAACVPTSRRRRSTSTR